jgi:hypothetical protein
VNSQAERDKTPTTGAGTSFSNNERLDMTPLCIL